MSFDVNVGRPQPMIKAASNMNNDGGSGGNTGYMMRGRRKNEKSNKSLFDNDNSDSFVMGSKLPRDYEKMYEEKESWFSKLFRGK